MSGTVARAAHPLAALLPLTSLRFFAAFYIVLAHTYRFLPPWLPPAGPPLWAMRAFGLGYSLVGLFFVLSGFALACVYLDRPAAPSIPYIRIDRARFFLARFARLYPVYLAMLLLDSPRWLYILHFRLHASLTYFAAVSLGNLLLLQAWFPNHLLLPNIPAWSISVEVLFYALFPFVGPVLWKMPRRYAAALGIALYAAGLGVAALIPVRMETDLALYYHPLAHVHEFLLGILLARFHVQYFAAASPSKLRGRALLIGMCALAVTFMAAAALLPLARYRVLLQHGALFPLYAALILLFCSRNATVERIFNARWLVRMGEASYGLYLVHRPLFPLFHPAIERYGWPALLYLAACIALSLASLRYLEAPARRRILEWHRARTQPRETLAVASLS